MTLDGKKTFGNAGTSTGATAATSVNTTFYQSTHARSSSIMPLQWACIEKQLYEKKGDTQILLQAYRRPLGTGSQQHGREMVLISGPSGVGKTSLALTLEDTVRQDGGFFCRGKFDQPTNTVAHSSVHFHPSSSSYGPFVAAMTDYVRQVLQRGRTFAQSIQTSLNLLLDASEREVLEESIPELRRITRIRTTSSRSGAAAADEETRWLGLKGLDAEKRYIHLFTRLVQAICSPDRTIVMLIDDLQWADEKSLELLRVLTACTTTGLILIICTSRIPPKGRESSSSAAEEGKKEGSCSRFISELKENGVCITEIQLGFLNENDISILVSDLLQLSIPEVRQLSKIAYRATNGNLFFLVQFLNALQEEGILFLNSVTGHWCWAEVSVRNAISDQPSMLNFLAKRVSKLTEYEQRLLQTASCLGGDIYENLLAETVLPSASVRPALIRAKDLGLIRFDIQTGSGSFSHDQIQEAIYSLIPESNRAKMHLDIGLRLWIWLPPSEKEAHLFTIVGQIIHGLHLLDDPIEKEDLAKLMLRAAQKAAQMSSFSTAAAYFKIGMSLLRRNHWKHQYDLSLALYNAAVEVEYYNGNIAQVDALLASIFKHATSLDHKLQAYFTQIYSLYSRDDPRQAFYKGLEVLALLGVTFPRKPGKMRGAYAWGRCKWQLQGMDDNSIMNLPIMTDSRKLVIMRLLALATTGAALTNEKFVSLTVSRMVDHTLRHGISEISCYSFAVLGVCLGRQGQLKEEYRFGRLALQLMDKFNAREWQCRVVLLHYAGGRQRLQEQTKPLQSAHRAGLVAGDIGDSMVCASRLCRVCFFAAAPIAQVVEVLTEYKKLCHQYSQVGVQTMLSHQLQMCHNFMGRSEDPLVLSGEEMNEEETIAVLQGRHMSTLAWLLIMKHMLAVYFNDHPMALSLSKILSDMKTSAVMPAVLRIHLFHECLCAAALSRGDSRQKARSRQILANLKACQHGHSDNFANKILLVEAEMADREEAKVKYERSIGAARQEGFLHEQALAAEMAGRAHLRWAEPTKAREYLISAQSLYEQWGADAKVHQMQLALDSFHE